MNSTREFKMLGVNIGKVPLSILTNEALDLINGKPGQIAFACANPHSLVTAKSDKDFFVALNNAEQVVADGVGTLLGAKMMGIKNVPRIAGADYFYSIMSALNALEGKRVFFLGSTEAVLALIRDRARREYPDIDKIGTLSPPFGEWSDQEHADIIETINAFNADVLWVGMTAPKQEKWVARNRSLLNAPVMGSIGAVFDFYAGTHPRAPRWMHDNGLEWLFRLIREPRRMWRRNFISTPKFILHVLVEHFIKRS